MNTNLVLLGLIIICLPSGKMGRGGGEYGIGRERVSEGLEHEMTHHLHTYALTIHIGLEAATVRIRAYRATGEVDNASKYNARVAITQGTTTPSDL